MSSPSSFSIFEVKIPRYFVWKSHQKAQKELVFPPAVGCPGAKIERCTLRNLSEDGWAKTKPQANRANLVETESRINRQGVHDCSCAFPRKPVTNQPSYKKRQDLGHKWCGSIFCLGSRMRMGRVGHFEALYCNLGQVSVSPRRTGGSLR